MQKKDCLTNEQHDYLKFYNFGLMQIKQGSIENGKRAMICAAGALINIASIVSEDIKGRFIEKAGKILENCAKLADPSFRCVFGTLEDATMGLDCPEVDFVDIKDTINDCAMDKVAGLEEVKEEIKRQIVYPFKYPGLFKRYKKKSGGGILLYGLPGTGKTMIARAIAKDIDAAFFPIKCSDLLSKWFGESEVNIKELFDKARKCDKAIIFFDEFEAIGSRRTGDSEHAINRVVTELLNQMDGYVEQPAGNLVVIAATNRPWDIDSAFLRPGRFNRKIYVPLPDEASRSTLISLAFKDIPVSDDFTISELVAVTHNYSGADTVELCECAKMYAIEREIQSKKNSAICKEDLTKARNAVNTSITEHDVKAMEKYRNVVKTND